jgi:hypothetical protein
MLRIEVVEQRQLQTAAPIAGRPTHPMELYPNPDCQIGHFICHDHRTDYLLTTILLSAIAFRYRASY